MIFRHYLYSLSYENSDAYTVLLGDKPRVDAYIQAIEEVVSINDSLVELGSGPGYFGRFASKRCSEVTLVEATENGVKIANLLNNLIAPKANITTVHEAAEDVRLKKHNVVVHELIGGRVFDEGLRSTSIAFAKNNPWIIEPDVTFIPAEIEIWVMLVKIDTDVRIAEWNASHPEPTKESNPDEKLIWATSESDYEQCSDWVSVTKVSSKNPETWPEMIEIPYIEVTSLGANALLWGFVAALSENVSLDVRLGSGVPNSWGGTIELLPARLDFMGGYKLQLSLGPKNSMAVHTDSWVMDLKRVDC